MIKMAVISPHAPILLPEVGSDTDREKVKKTLVSLNALGKKFQQENLDEIIISSPHEDWGFNVPLFFLAPNFKGKISPYLTSFESPVEHFVLGRKITENLDPEKAYALIASGDLSHVLMADGPYGYHPDGPKFDQALLKLLAEKRVPEILKLADKFPGAADCGLRSFALALGLLSGCAMKINPQILSYEGPFGVGYLVARII
ncbi:MAG: class III extradiol dioxygenase subunit B-like domain-containing protein [Candidatus Moraniibacteriota bacterium]